MLPWAGGTIFDSLGAIQADYNGYPEVNAGALYPVTGVSQVYLIEFMEQLFEWTNLSYTLYPYFWGRKSEWLESLGLKQPDPQFLRFLQAGAAQVTLPIRPGKEMLAMHLLENQEIWWHDLPPPPLPAQYAHLTADLFANPPELQDPTPVDDGTQVKTPAPYSLRILGPIW